MSKIHTYVKHADVYTVGYLAKLRPDGVQSFLALLDVPTLHDAVLAVNVLNGGNVVQSLNILKEHTVPIPTQQPKTMRATP